MKFVFFLVSIFFSSVSLAQPVIKAADLKLSLGNWGGSYTYKSESTGENIDLKASVKLGPIVNGNRIAVTETLVAQQDDGTNGSGQKIDTLVFSADGNYINDLRLASRKKSTDQFQFVLETEGEDAGQKAEIRITYVFTKNRFTLKKEVRYRDQQEYFTRHEYKLTRK